MLVLLGFVNKPTGHIHGNIKLVTRPKIMSCKLLKTGLNNVALPTLFNVVNNIEQVVKPESSPQSGVTMLNNMIRIHGCRNSARSCAEQIYWRNACGHCVIIKYIISTCVLTLLAWMNLHVMSQQTTPTGIRGTREWFHVASTSSHISIKFPVVYCWQHWTMQAAQHRSILFSTTHNFFACRIM